MNYQRFIDEKVHQLRVVCRSQWDYLNYSKLFAWLEDNLNGDLEGKYYIIKILLHTVYYRKRDIERLIEYGLYEKIYGSIVKKELVSNGNIYVPNSDAIASVDRLKANSFFIPLLDSNKPSESGNIFIGDLVHKLGIKEGQVDFHWNVSSEKLENKQLLIFVDDSIGSGMQLKKFWNSEPIQNIKNICGNLGIKIFYLVLLGYKNNLEKLQEEKKISDIEIIVCDILTDKNRVFSEENIIWDKNTDERELAIEYFERLKKERGVSFLGFKKLDFAVILNDRLPNWSLPIFWKESSNWKSLLKRKTSTL